MLISDNNSLFSVSVVQVEIGIYLPISNYKNVMIKVLEMLQCFGEINIHAHLPSALESIAELFGDKYEESPELLQALISIQKYCININYN